MNEPAFPYRYQEVAEPPHYYHGLTKRELFAAMAMQGLLGNSNIEGDAGQPRHIAGASLIYAEALLAALEEKEHPHD